MDQTVVGDELKDLWDTVGWCVVDGVIPPDDLAAAQQDLPDLFPTAQEFAEDKDPERNLPFRTASDAVLPRFPFASAALNHLVLHDAIIDLAERFLGTADIRLYQGMVSAKYSNGAPDYEQLLHADYANHTLVVPRSDPGYQQIEMFIYLSDVTAETAATRIVSRPLTQDIPVERTYLALDEYADLYAAEEPASGPAGSVLVYRPDVYHRGTRLTAKEAARYLLHVAYKPLGADWLGYQSWPAAAEGLAWNRFMKRATVRQLTMLGFPEPGHRYWTEETLAGVAARYPLLDMTPWRDQMGQRR
jgi:ectoine hydroxylase-related dioxygenase (phytanoyl-CoA dioxygenase family)